MQIDDAGGEPTKLAASIVSQLTDLGQAVPVREVALAVGIYEIQEEPLSGFEGALITSPEKVDGMILVNSNSSEERKRFSIGHELGHYLNPWHKPTNPQGFRCSSRDMSAERFRKGDRAVQMEVEANEFASELLMPKEQVRIFIKRRPGLDIDHIIAMAKRFQVSREAAGRRYVHANDEPAALVLSMSGIIRYVIKQQYFPSLDVWNGDQLPNYSLSLRSALPIGKTSEWEEVDGGIWLSSPKRRSVCEQTLSQHNGYRMTLLTLGDAEDEDRWEASRLRR
jgi:Zn-dependent peptidase ImmA (M78 family)